MSDEQKAIMETWREVERAMVAAERTLQKADKRFREARDALEALNPRWNAARRAKLAVEAALQTVEG